MKSQNRRTVYLTPYVEEPLNSKVIKSFVPELRSRYVFFRISRSCVLCISSSSSSCRAAITDILDPLSPLFLIIHRFWQVFRLHPVFLHSTNYTATCLPSRKLYKLDEPDTQDTAGEARMNPSVMYFYGQGKAGRPCIYIYIYIYIRTLYVHFAYPYQAMVHTGKRFTYCYVLPIIQFRHRLKEFK